MRAVLARTFPLTLVGLLFLCGTVEPVVVLVAALITLWANHRDDCEIAARRLRKPSPKCSSGRADVSATAQVVA